MDTISGISLSKGMFILGLVLAVTQGRPGTNFAGSSITSDSSGTRASHLVGSVPDYSSSDPNPRVYSSKTVGSGSDNGGGATILTTRNGGGTVLTGTSSNGGATLLSGTSSSGGGGVGVLSRTGPSGTGTQYSVLVPSNQPQPSVLARFGQSQPQPSVYSGSGSGGGGFVGVGSGTYGGTGAGVYSGGGAYGGGGTGAYGGAASGAYAGPGGASASAFAGPVQSGYDYYG